MRTPTMFNKIAGYFRDLRDRQRVDIALSRGGALMSARQIDLTDPTSWEFSGFSQNGEDGILEVLRRNLKSRNRYFIEIGAADGIENNTGWLAVAEKYSGLMIEGSAFLVERARRVVGNCCIGVDFQSLFVTRATVPTIKNLALHLNPDVFSLDIDGNDYYIARDLMAAGVRPKIFVVEYNSALTPDRSITVKYNDTFVITNAHPSHLYYGVSITAWKNFFASQGYRFVTVDQAGVNAFFVDPSCFDSEFLNNINGLPYVENQSIALRHRVPVQDQFAKIANCEFVTIGPNGQTS